VIDQGREVPDWPELAGRLSRFPPAIVAERWLAPVRSRANLRHRTRIYAPSGS
jgi:hypothetical protein